MTANRSSACASKLLYRPALLPDALVAQHAYFGSRSPVHTGLWPNKPLLSSGPGPAPLSRRGRWRAFNHDELSKRDKLNLDLLWRGQRSGGQRELARSRGAGRGDRRGPARGARSVPSDLPGSSNRRETVRHEARRRGTNAPNRGRADGPWILLPRAQRVIAGVITTERQST